MSKAGFPIIEKKVSLTGSGIIAPQPGMYFGWLVTTGLSAAAITIYDNTTNSGTIIDAIAASTAANTRGQLVVPVRLSIGAYASFGGTGTVTFFYCA